MAARIKATRLGQTSRPSCSLFEVGLSQLIALLKKLMAGELPLCCGGTTRFRMVQVSQGGDVRSATRRKKDAGGR